MDLIDWGIVVAKVLFSALVVLNAAPIMSWVERRGSALMQNRLGPNRLGPLGLIQPLADAVKFIFKEDSPPGYVDAFYWQLAPLVSLVPAFLTFAVVPWAAPLDIAGRHIVFQVADLNVGILYVFAIASLGVYGVVMAGWSSNNKYALLGSIRSTSQMISYELSMGLSVVGLLMIFQSVHLGDIAAAQTQTLFHLGPIPVPKWGIFIQPVAFLIFLTTALAETNNVPFDLAEGESEIVAGYHLEYGSMKFALFMMAEYGAKTTASALMATLFFGGWHAPGAGHLLTAIGLSGQDFAIAMAAVQILTFLLKTAFFLWLFVWIRWTLPRFRFDQIMDLGWKILLPLSLLNIFVTGLLIYYEVV
jgi:NADH-quinone oxidoreductase subunit H